MNDEKHVIENIKAAESALPCSMKRGELAVIKNVAESFRRLMKVPCTGCQYCMPCPYGVNIPSNFRIYNDYYMFGDEQESRAMYAMMLMGGLTGKRSDASLCIECKKCIVRCPQHIEIPQELKLVLNDLGGPKTEAIFSMRKSRRRKEVAKTASISKKRI
jgi:predicted aldo/keto reductase-like oxidoreductase